MRSKLLASGEEKTYAVVFDKGDEVLPNLAHWAARQDVSAARITGIGAFSRVVVGFFDRDRKDYRRIPIDEQVEVLSLVGDIALKDGSPQVHAHVVVGFPDGSTRGGHLLEGEVWPTLEVLVSESPGHLRKSHDPETGLALIDLGRATP